MGRHETSLEECFQVDAGDEFLAAEREAQRRQLPCLCIDLDMVSWMGLDHDVDANYGASLHCHPVIDMFFRNKLNEIREFYVILPLTS